MKPLRSPTSSRQGGRKILSGNRQRLDRLHCDAFSCSENIEKQEKIAGSDGNGKKSLSRQSISFV
jgi:hypothetical protein